MTFERLTKTTIEVVTLLYFCIYNKKLFNFIRQYLRTYILCMYKIGNLEIIQNNT